MTLEKKKKALNIDKVRSNVTCERREVKDVEIVIINLKMKLALKLYFGKF